MTPTSPAVEFRNVWKRFEHLVANQEVSFAVEAGSIHGVVGENGAGKSTIMKVLYGLYEADEGEIIVHGATARLRSPHDAIGLGIGMVHQHFMLIPTLPVWKNVILGAENSFLLKESAILRELSQLQKSFGLSLDLTTQVSNLSVGEQQQVEILKVLYRKAAILILDEPTAVLTPHEVDVLFERLLDLNAAGKTIILISHKLHEILRFTKNVTVMRQAKVVCTVPTSSLTENTLAEAIIGRPAKPLAKLTLTQKQTDQRPVFQVKNLSLAKSGAPHDLLREVSFSVCPGEIVGIAGISGNGQQELIEVIAGIESRYDGEVTLLDRGLRTWSTYQVKQNGFALIPADRNEEGLIGNFSVQDNLTLGHHHESRHCRSFYRQPAQISKTTIPLLDKYDIRPRSLEAYVKSLSGGNQQKVIIAREMDQDVRFLLAAYPTRGVDIGAIEFIYDLFQKRKAEGTGILLISSELDELFALSDRILVLFEGKIAGEADPKQCTPRQIGLMMTGGASG